MLVSNNTLCNNFRACCKEKVAEDLLFVGGHLKRGSRFRCADSEVVEEFRELKGGQSREAVAFAES
eukprot:2424466-Amphidinium_carterae.1